MNSQHFCWWWPRGKITLFSNKNLVFWNTEASQAKVKSSKGHFIVRNDDSNDFLGQNYIDSAIVSNSQWVSFNEKSWFIIIITICDMCKYFATMRKNISLFLFYQLVNRGFSAVPSLGTIPRTSPGWSYESSYAPQRNCSTQQTN